MKLWINNFMCISYEISLQVHHRKGIQLHLVQSQKERHSMTKSPSFLSLSLPTPHSTPTSPPPYPPSPTISIPIPLSGCRASHSTCSHPSDITRWLKLLAAPQCGVPLVATKTTSPTLVSGWRGWYFGNCCWTLYLLHTDNTPWGASPHTA